MAIDTKMLEQIFESHLEAAEVFMETANNYIEQGFQAFADASNFAYTPYEWQSASPPVIAYAPTYNIPAKPGMPGEDAPPQLAPFPTIANPSFSKPAGFHGTKPNIQYPPKPSGPPSDPTGHPPPMTPLHFPSTPSLLPLPSTALPYPYLTIPDAPVIVMPIFDGVKPDPIHTISLQEYLDMLTEAYERYSQDIPALVRANWFAWFNAYLDERPLIDKIAGVISTYIDTGGAGIPVPIEEAIVTRGTDRVVAEQRRATLNVYQSATKRGLYLPSGVLVAGLKEARQVSNEAVSKVATDVAIKNLELEHKHMEFMLKLGSELEQWIANFAMETCKQVIAANAQAIEMTKFILTGMIEINNTIVKIYLAQWEAYKAAVEVYKARISALEMEIRLYEAQIKAELAKVEINKAHVEMLQAIVQANTSIVMMYKAQIDAETAKIEADRVRVMIYEATVRAYGVRVEAWKAQWAGYTAAIEGEVAKVKVYEAEVNAYGALVNAYKAEVEGYSALVRGQAEQIKAIGVQNETNLKSWGMVAEQNMKGYVAGVEAYKAEWEAVAVHLRGYAEGTRIIADSMYKGYESMFRVDTERAREHLAEWQGHVQSTLKAAEGVVHAASVSGQIAASALNGLVAFAGNIATASSSGA